MPLLNTDPYYAEEKRKMYNIENIYNEVEDGYKNGNCILKLSFFVNTERNSYTFGYYKITKNSGNKYYLKQLDGYCYPYEENCIWNIKTDTQQKTGCSGKIVGFITEIENYAEEQQHTIEQRKEGSIKYFLNNEHYFFRVDTESEIEYIEEMLKKEKPKNKEKFKRYLINKLIE